MHENNPNNQPSHDDRPRESHAPQTNPEHKSQGPGGIAGIIIIIAIVVLGGLYLWGQALEEREQSAEEILNKPDQTTQELKQQSTSTAIESIEKDLETTGLDNLDKELEDIESELNF